MKKILPLIVILALLLSACVPTAKTALKNRNVFYAGGNGGVKTALLQAGYTLVGDFDKADVFVLNGKIPDAKSIAFRLQAGAGLVLIIGEETSFYDVEIILGRPVSALIKSKNVVSLSVDKELSENDPLVTDIDWNTAPQIRERAFISALGPCKPLVRVTGLVEIFLGQRSENIFTINAFLDEQRNLPFQEWKYFNYLIYHLVERAAGAQPMTFSEYSALPK